MVMRRLEACTRVTPGLGLRAEGLGFGFQSLGFGFRVEGTRHREGRDLQEEGAVRNEQHHLTWWIGSADARKMESRGG